MIEIVKTGLLLNLVLLSVVDGLYLHLWRYRLQERPESKREHALHTLRAWLFLPLLLLLSMQPIGALFYTLLGFVGFDFMIGLADVLAEHQSRASLGGLSRGEYLLHVVLVMLHSSLLTLALVHPGSFPSVSAWLAGMLLPGTVVISLLHTWLLYTPQGISLIELKIKSCCRQQPI